MTTLTVFLSVLIEVVILFSLFCWLIKTFASMSEKGKRIYEDNA